LAAIRESLKQGGSKMKIDTDKRRQESTVPSKKMGDFGIKPTNIGYGGSTSLSSMAPPPDASRWASRTRPRSRFTS